MIVLTVASLTSPAHAIATQAKIATVRYAAISAPARLASGTPVYRQRPPEAAMVQHVKPRRAPARARTTRHGYSAPASAAGEYANPLRSMAGLSFGRIDAGVDFGGTGPVYAAGPGVVVSTYNDGWGPANGGAAPGGWICYELTAGPDSGSYIYIAEGVTSGAYVTEKITASTVIAYADGNGIETGWAAPGCAGNALDAYGGYPTPAGNSYSALLMSLGAPGG